jgi:hypothetical protein
MSDQTFLSIFNERHKVILAVKNFKPEEKDVYPVTNEDLGTPGIRADWSFDKVKGGYRILLDRRQGEPEFRLALDIESVENLKKSTKLRVIKSNLQVYEGSDLWALVGGSNYRYIISLAKDAPTVYAIDAGAGLYNRTHVWPCVADLNNQDSENQQWESNPINTQ